MYADQPEYGSIRNHNTVAPLYRPLNIQKWSVYDVVSFTGSEVEGLFTFCPEFRVGPTCMVFEMCNLDMTNCPLYNWL